MSHSIDFRHGPYRNITTEGAEPERYTKSSDYVCGGEQFGKDINNNNGSSGHTQNTCGGSTEADPMDLRESSSD